MKKWIDTPELKKNEVFVNEWHDFVNAVQDKINSDLDEEIIRKINLFILQHFYIEPYHKDDFYKQFETRLIKAKTIIGVTA